MNERRVDRIAKILKEPPDGHACVAMLLLKMQPYAKTPTQAWACHPTC